MWTGIICIVSALADAMIYLFFVIGFFTCSHHRWPCRQPEEIDDC